MAVSKAQQKAVTKYVKAKYDRFGLTMPKGHLDEIKSHAETQGESVNGFINRAIDNQISQDRLRGPSEALQGPSVGSVVSLPSEALQGPSVGSVVSLPSEAYKCAVEASEAAGEGLPDFVARAVTIQAKRDDAARKLGGK